MTSGAAVTAIAGELAKLLEDQPHFADFMTDLGRAASRDIETAAPLYQSLQLWGGPGSLADGAGIDLPMPAQRRVQALIVALFDRFEDAGIHYERAAMWTSAFRSWLQAESEKGGTAS